MIIPFILMTLMFGSGALLLQEVRCWSLSGVKVLITNVISSGTLVFRLIIESNPSAIFFQGMNKMVVNHLEKLFVTNDAATIIKELEVKCERIIETKDFELALLDQALNKQTRILSELINFEVSTNRWQTRAQDWTLIQVPLQQTLFCWGPKVLVW